MQALPINPMALAPPWLLVYSQSHYNMQRFHPNNFTNIYLLYFSFSPRNGLFMWAYQGNGKLFGHLRPREVSFMKQLFDH